jgi:hypothetical protein
VSEAALPDPASFSSGESGHVAGPRATITRALRDRALDLRLAATGTGRRLDRLAQAIPRRAVLVLGIYRPDDHLAAAVVENLRESRHDVRIALGSTGPPDPVLAAETVASGLGGGKFPNLNAVLGQVPADSDWVLVTDDDVRLPRRFLDRLLGVCESLSLDLAQPAQTLGSHAAWGVTRRRGGVLARETRFVEIGPVTLFSRRAAAELLPFPGLRYGWGLDLHWAALAAHRGWRLGIVDALPVRHERAAVAAAYSREEAVAEAQRFLAGRPYLPAERAADTLATHSSAPRA